MTDPRDTPSSQPAKSKTLATWLAVLGGSFGLHRFYLRGLRDVWGWVHVPMTLLGMAGVRRMIAFGQDDPAAPWLLPLGGLSIVAAMLAAIVMGLGSDERWDARHNAGRPAGQGTPASGWAAVLGVIAALLIGATVLLSSITFTLQRYFEAQVEAAHRISR
jgi:hypothetical protein